MPRETRKSPCSKDKDRSNEHFLACLTRHCTTGSTCRQFLACLPNNNMHSLGAPAGAGAIYRERQSCSQRVQGERTIGRSLALVHADPRLALRHGGMTVRVNRDLRSQGVTRGCRSQHNPRIAKCPYYSLFIWNVSLLYIVKCFICKPRS